jgi:hypothetical protein
MFFLSLQISSLSGRIFIVNDNLWVGWEFFCYHYMSNRFNDSLIYLGACDSAQNKGILLRILCMAGAKAVLGYSKPVATSYEQKMCQTIFQELVKTKSDGSLTTISQAIDAAKSKHGKTDNTYSKWNNLIADWIVKTFIDENEERFKPKSERAELHLYGNENFRLSDNMTGEENTNLNLYENIPDGYTPIYTAEDLDNIRENLSDKYILMNDIDLSSWGDWTPTVSFFSIF